MIAIVDKRIPQEAKENLRKRFTLFELESKDIVYPEISGHPDIFIHSSLDIIVIAPNSPLSLINFLKSQSIKFLFGKYNLGFSHPNTSPYNAVISSTYLLHNFTYTDIIIKELNSQKEQINVQQSYTRCNVISLQNDIFITSDKGIYTTLRKHDISAFWISPKGILLENFDYGFIGGCVGIIDREIYFIGSLKYFSEGKKLRKILESQGYKVIELYEGPLFDGGSIFFI